MENKNVVSNAWYEKKWLIAILCFLFYPLGLYALWKNSSISKGWKTGITAIFALFTIAIIKSGPPKKPDTSEQEKPVYKYEVVKVEKKPHGIFLKLTVDGMYSREELIEKTRQLRKEYDAKKWFSCYYYYKKYTPKMPPGAWIQYIEDCSNCQDKDKDGNLVQFPFYHIRKSSFDSLNAMPFDSAGFKKEATSVAMSVFPSKTILFSSSSSRALLVRQFLTGNVFESLTKEVVSGQQRYYSSKEDNAYYVINRELGIIDYYYNGELNWQELIEG